MRAPIDPVHEGRNQTTHPSPEARGSEGTMDAPRETEASCEEIER